MKPSAVGVAGSKVGTHFASRAVPASVAVPSTNPNCTVLTVTVALMPGARLPTVTRPVSLILAVAGSSAVVLAVADQTRPSTAA